MSAVSKQSIKINIINARHAAGQLIEAVCIAYIAGEAVMSSELIKKLESLRSSIRFESDEDEGAGEFYAHVSDVIADVQSGKMNQKAAEDSLGVRL